MRLRDWRIDQGLTQNQVAERLKVGVSSVSRYELGRVPDADVMRRIYSTTNGRVGPADFYDLPILDAEPDAA